MKDAKYIIRGYCADTDGGYDEESCADTMKEAIAKAKDMMTDEHVRYVESFVPVKYVLAKNELPMPVSCSDEQYFSWHNDATNLGRGQR